MIDAKTIGSRIKELRQQKGITQSQFAEILFVSFQAVSNWERGIAPPDLENLVRIASYFGVLTDDLIRPKKDGLFLGIDGGGTKTEFVVVSSEGHVLKEITREGCNPNDIGFTKAVSVICEGIRDILIIFPAVKTVFCGIAGIMTGDYKQRLSAELEKSYPQLKIDIKNDSYNLFAMYDDAEMAVISGTGSVVFAKHSDSTISRLGGWGYLLDNAGSAYDIGRNALQIALEQEDQKQEPTILSKLLLKRIGTDTVWEHISNIYNGSKPYIASFASVVFDAYKLGDQSAIDIVDKNAKALAEMMNSAVKLYGVKPIAVASGGIFEHYEDIMKAHIQKYSQVELIITGLPPVCGACRIACAMANEHVTDDFYSNFKKTYGGRMV
jgi:N-acetylglucosamine kinase-like BadF-type ATPase